MFASNSFDVASLDIETHPISITSVKRNYHVRAVDWDTHRDRLLSIRRKVFIEEQGIPEAMELDEEDASALHLLALDEKDKPIGTARLAMDGRIGRVAVLAHWRKSGVGSSLMKPLIREAGVRGMESVYLHAQTTSLTFYEKLGFCPVGIEFEEAGIPHFEMILRHLKQQSSSV